MSLPAVTPSTLPGPIMSTLWSEFGIRAVSADVISGGFDPDATVWRVLDDGGAGWAVKSSRRDCRFGLALASALALSGQRGVVAPRLTRDQKPWSGSGSGSGSGRGRSSVSVSRWIDGDDALAAGLRPEQWRDFGALLRAVHEHRPPVDVSPTRRGIKRTGQFGVRRLGRLDHRFARVDVVAADAVETDDLRALWREHRHRLARLDRVARELKGLRTPATRVPCHGDPHLGNVLLAADGHPQLIDFDEATTAHREVDLVLIELGVLPRRQMECADRRAFWGGYGAIHLDEARITRFGCVRALEDVTSVFAELSRGQNTVDLIDHIDLRETLHDLLGPKGLIAQVEERLGR